MGNVDQSTGCRGRRFGQQRVSQVFGRDQHPIGLKFAYVPADNWCVPNQFAYGNDFDAIKQRPFRRKVLVKEFLL
jgi:hypothetical protein